MTLKLSAKGWWSAFKNQYERLASKNCNYHQLQRFLLVVTLNGIVNLLLGLITLFPRMILFSCFQLVPCGVFVVLVYKYLETLEYQMTLRSLTRITLDDYTRLRAVPWLSVGLVYSWGTVVPLFSVYILLHAFGGVPSLVEFWLLTNAACILYGVYVKRESLSRAIDLLVHSISFEDTATVVSEFFTTNPSASTTTSDRPQLKPLSIQELIDAHGETPGRDVDPCPTPRR
jgi:hypothetical protein